MNYSVLPMDPFGRKYFWNEGGKKFVLVRVNKTLEYNGPMRNSFFLNI